ncbi:hypothetical protein AKO1_002594 [Acrasis kona]|uniref:Uncharacterized protein n=1 Tax=Acrasis kona TaxID=1008807 RepID=A0AAW2ZN76_9EUKA
MLSNARRSTYIRLFSTFVPRLNNKREGDGNSVKSTSHEFERDADPDQVRRGKLSKNGGAHIQSSAEQSAASQHTPQHDNDLKNTHRHQRSQIDYKDGRSRQEHEDAKKEAYNMSEKHNPHPEGVHVVKDDVKGNFKKTNKD